MADDVLRPDDPGLTLFFVALPDPVPIPHDSVISFEIDENVPHLVGVPRHAAQGQPPIPHSENGQSFVSLKFWQVKSSSDVHFRSLQAVGKVVRTVRGESVPASDQPTSDATITVVEMVTPSPTASAEVEGDPFLRCLACLVQVVDAYRISENIRLARLSYERLDPFVLKYGRSIREPYEWSGPQMMRLDNVNIAVPSPDPLSSEQMQRLLLFIQNLRAGHPFSAWAQLCRERDFSFQVDGNYRVAVVQAALATEVLVSTVLACILWEQKFPATAGRGAIGEAVELLGKKPATLRAELGKLLGGNWDPKGASASGVWQRDGASLRNRVVHLGYDAERGEAGRAIASAVALDAFIRERLAARVSDYPRTAALLLGRPGLERLEANTRKVQEVIESADSEPDWVRSYLDWRQSLEEQFEGTD